jgi:hypothetical protein
LVIHPPHDGTKGHVVVDIPLKNLLHNGGFWLVHGADTCRFIPSVAIEFGAGIMSPPRLDARPLAAQGPLANLLRLHLGRISAHEPNELALRGVIQRLRHKLDGDVMMFRLTEDDTKMDRIAAQSIDGVGHDHRHGVLPNRLSEFAQTGALPQFGAGVHIAIDVRLIHEVATIRGVRSAVVLLGHQRGAVLLLADGAHPTVN